MDFYCEADPSVGSCPGFRFGPLTTLPMSLSLPGKSCAFGQKTDLRADAVCTAQMGVLVVSVMALRSVLGAYWGTLGLLGQHAQHAAPADFTDLYKTK